MKYCLVFLLILGYKVQGQSISDTVFFDSKWHKSSRDSFTFYRTTSKKNDLYQVTDHYKDGSIQMLGTCSSLDPEVKNGFFTYYYLSGHKKTECEFYNNKRTGVVRNYEDSTGRLRSYIEYKDDLKNGKLIRYFNDGITTTCIYKNDKLVIAKAEKDNVDIINEEVEIFKEILNKKFLLTIPDSLKYISGEVKVVFEVDTDGTIFNVTRVSGVTPRLIHLVMQSVKEMPKLTPEISEKNVKVYHSFTVLFPQMAASLNLMRATNTVDSGKSDSIMITSDLLSRIKPKYVSWLSDTLHRYFKLRYDKTFIESDTSIHRDVIVNFSINEKGGIIDTKVIKSGSKKQTDFVIKMMKKYSGWKAAYTSRPPKPNYYTVTVWFPGVYVYCMTDLKIYSGSDTNHK